jgi:uncharacterized protein
VCASSPTRTLSCQRFFGEAHRVVFSAGLSRTRFTASFLISRYTQLATVIASQETYVVKLRDRDDETVVACALAAHAELIVSGDRDLRELQVYEGVRIVTVAEAMSLIGGGC